VRRLGDLWRDPRHAFPEEAQEHGGAHAVVKGDGDLIWQRVLQDCGNGRPQPIYEGGKSKPRGSCRPAGTCCPAMPICGHPCKPCAAAPNTVPFVRYGAPMGSSRGSATAIRYCKKLSRSAAGDFALLPWRMITSIRSRWKTSVWPNAATMPSGWSNCVVSAPNVFALLARLSQLPDDTVFYPDHHGGGR